MPKYIFNGPGVLRLTDEPEAKEYVSGDEVELTEVQVIRLRNASLFFEEAGKGKQAGANDDKASASAENKA